MDSTDIADAFYNLNLPEVLRRNFAMPLKVLSGQEMGSPWLAELPKGWSHALYWSQEARPRSATER